MRIAFLRVAISCLSKSIRSLGLCDDDVDDDVGLCDDVDDVDDDDMVGFLEINNISFYVFDG